MGKEKDPRSTQTPDVSAKLNSPTLEAVTQFRVEETTRYRRRVLSLIFVEKEVRTRAATISSAIE